MQLDEFIKTGMSAEIIFQVEERHSAAHVGSGSLKVLASPVMIAYMERAARNLLANSLPDEYSSVGVHVDIHHLAASPLGARVRVRCEIQGIDGRRVDFAVQAWDEQEIIGRGTHQRVVIDIKRFLSRVETKQG